MHALAKVPDRRVLVVDDDTELREQVMGYLREHGYEVRGARDGVEMQRLLDAGVADLVVLDVMMPGEDGLSLCKKLSAEGRRGIIMLSAMGQEVDRVLGLELGADDYLAKPCSPRELLARVRAVFRRLEETAAAPRPRGAVYRFAEFVLDTGRRRLRSPTGTTILLTSGEYALLQAFLERPQAILSRDRLLDVARGDHSDVFDRAVDVQICRLRRKLHTFAEGELIKTIRGVGYVLDVPVARA